MFQFVIAKASETLISIATKSETIHGLDLIESWSESFLYENFKIK